MAYKVKLSKRKNYTGEELGKLGILKFCYDYKNRYEEDQPTFFNDEIYVDKVFDLKSKDPYQYAIYEDYEHIRDWLANYENIMWGHDGMTQLFISGISSSITEAYTLTAIEYTKEKAAADGATDIAELLGAVPAEAGAWGREDDTLHRLGYVNDRSNGFKWGALSGYFKLKTFNKVLSIVAEKHGIPELEAFNKPLEDHKADIEKIKDSAERLEQLRRRLSIKKIDRPLGRIVSDFINMPEALGWECYTEKSIAKTKELLDGEDGFICFIGSDLIDTLYVDPLAFMSGDEEND